MEILLTEKNKKGYIYEKSDENSFELKK